MLRRRRLVALLTFLALSSCPAAAGAAGDRVPPRFLGVVADRWATDGTFPMGAQMRRMADAGAQVVGVTFPWLPSQPVAGGPYDFSVIDARVAAAARADLEVHPVVIAAPAWARLHPSLEFSPPRDPQEYAAFAAALVQRYGPEGTFWAEHPGLPRLPIRDWQIWNEPVGGDGDDTPSIFWQDDERFDVRYLPMLRAAYAAIHAEDPGATVVLGALVGQSWGQLELLYGAGARGAFDAVGLHPYTADAVNVLKIVRMVRRVMRRNGDGALPIQVTEISWPAFSAEQVKALGIPEANRVQAGWLRAAVGGLLRRRAALGVDLVLWYSWIGRDRSGRNPFDHSGLLRLEPSGKLREKPALRAFAAVARRHR